ncbi:hypothetical protein HYQ44_004816 [Verticillium longisporum]|nr:hypothetical protein HYQ44_004816 [Verticillium longisporum]
MDPVFQRIRARQDKFDAGQELLDLLQDPFAGQLQQTSFFAALGTSVLFTLGIAIAFSFLRPYNQSVYAPKTKHADEKHAPPPIGRKLWSWVFPLWSTTEYEFIQYAGMDAAIFMRFVEMLRNLFVTLCVFVLAILIPVNLTQVDVSGEGRAWLAMLTPSNVWGDAQWAQVTVAYGINAIVMFFLWWNTKKVLHLRRRYFESDEYQNSLHARTLMLYDLPKDRSSDEGIARIIDEVVPSSSFSRTAVARNVKDLPKLIAQHDHTVRKLESVLAKYMKNPAQLPPNRPLCKPSKKDPSFSTYPKGQKVDAIEYLTQRIKTLEVEIKQVRQSVDKRSSMPYGFASYSDITEAHNIAYACRKKHPHGSTIKLAPRPNDIIWNNLPLSASTRRWRRVINNLWITLLTFIWIGPNAMIAVFLVNLNNLGRVWREFQTELVENKTFWAFVQGIAAPAITSLVFLVLPIIFRRLSIKAGDQTKSGRERHVVAKLYAFFVFNNLVVFSLFSATWTFVAGVINRTGHGADAWDAILEENIADTLFLALCTVSPFWVNWLLQRQLGAAIDLAQFWPLIYSFFARKFSSPTPRDLIELTAPPAFDYAPYYNYFLYYSTIALCFAGIQPITLPAVALYFAIDVWLKRYLLLYVFVTKTESGGMFWRVVFNRVIFATMLADLVFFLTCWFVSSRQFDDKIRYYSTLNVAKHPESGLQKEQRLRSERLASRFGHPALYKPLITPMGRLSDGREAGGMDGMSPGKQMNTNNRPEFADEHGQGDLFGADADRMRPGTPGSHGGDSDYSRPGTPTMNAMAGGMTGFNRPLNRAPTHDFNAAASGYHSPNGGRASPGPGFPQGMGYDRSRSPLYSNNSVGGGRDRSVDSFRMAPTPGPSTGALGGGPRGQYDYFRGNARSQRRPGEGW